MLGEYRRRLDLTMTVSFEEPCDVVINEIMTRVDMSVLGSWQDVSC